jgi:hypothetical protein
LAGSLEESIRRYLLKRYAALRSSLPQDKGEVKGRLLSEQQVGQVVSLLKNKGAFFEVVTTDMSLNTEEVVDRHRRGQAQGITKNLTDEHQPTLVAESWKLREQLEAMALQLYVQSVLTFELVTPSGRRGGATLRLGQAGRPRTRIANREMDGRETVSASWYTLRTLATDEGQKHG